MCLLVIAWRKHPQFRLIVAANRDEFHERPATPLAHWADSPGLFAGRDLQAGGTWLAVDEQSRFGVITNHRDLQRPKPGAPSRGELLTAYLRGTADAEEFVTALQDRGAKYAGFNLLLADARSLWYAANRGDPFARELTSGVYGLSNHLLDTPWPKLTRVRTSFEKWLPKADASRIDELFAMLADTEPAQAEPIAPAGRIPPDIERALAAPFVLNPVYGTRCSTIVLMENSGAALIAERTFDLAGEVVHETSMQLAAPDATAS